MSKKIKFGEWQLCPKCNGTGRIISSDIPYTYTWGTITASATMSTSSPCDVCDGAKIIQRPVIKDKE